MTWTSDWPTVPGYYWFYGWCFWDRAEGPLLHYVKVVKTSNGIAHITDEHFIYKEEGGIGLWAIVVFPDLPTEQLKDLTK